MKKTLAFILALALILSLAACGNDSAPAVSPTDTATPAPDPAETPAPTPEPVPEEPALSSEPVKVMVLNGTTGFGMAGLMDSAARGEAALNYEFSVETDASNITAALINGSVDIAALPTNAASVVYNKTQGEVQALALNTLGVLYVVADKSLGIETLADLEGRTVYAPAQNPSFIFSYIASAAGVNVSVDNTFAQPADLRTAVAAGEAEIAVLPEPMVTMACAANEELAVCLDLTAEWAAVNEAELVQGCVVVRRDFAESHPAEVAAFLEEYETSIALLESDPAAAAELIVAAGIFANAAVAQKAIPKCNVCFIAGQDMLAPLGGFLEAMFSVAPASVGGAVPAEDFYYIP